MILISQAVSSALEWPLIPLEAAGMWVMGAEGDTAPVETPALSKITTMKGNQP